MNTTTDSKTFIKLFTDIHSAEHAYKSALMNGYNSSDINVIMSENTKKQYFDSILVEPSKSNQVLAGAGLGGTLGGLALGALAMTLASGTEYLLPELGLIVSGPLMVGLAGVGVGCFSGGLIGALVGWGLTSDKAQLYKKGIENGGIILATDSTHSNRKALEQEWHKLGA